MAVRARWEEAVFKLSETIAGEMQIDKVQFVSNSPSSSPVVITPREREIKARVTPWGSSATPTSGSSFSSPPLAGPEQVIYKRGLSQSIKKSFQTKQNKIKKNLQRAGSRKTPGPVISLFLQAAKDP